MGAPLDRTGKTITNRDVIAKRYPGNITGFALTVFYDQQRNPVIGVGAKNGSDGEGCSPRSG